MPHVVEMRSAELFARFQPMDSVLKQASDGVRLDWLDALRGWAVLGVVLVHTGEAMHFDTGFWQQFTAAGQYGVQLFFVVSALTISITYSSHVARLGPGFRTAASWYVKRFFRIAPLYYVAILFFSVEQYAIYVGSHHRYGHLPLPLSDIAANIAFIHTWVPAANNNVVPGGWSIGVEMFFYLLVPLIWSIRGDRARTAMLGLAILPAISLSVVANFAVAGTFHVTNNSFFYYWFPSQYPVIALGLIYFFVAIEPGSKSRFQYSTWLYLAGFFVLAIATLFGGTWKGYAPVFAPALAGTAFICAIAALRGIVRVALVNVVVVFWGRISYSVYIFHFFVLDAYRAIVFRGPAANTHSPRWIVVVLPAVLLATSGVAYLSKRYIEDPGIKLGRRVSVRIASDAQTRVVPAKAGSMDGRKLEEA